MKNDARFFFCFTGFVGFLLFYLTASLLHQNFAFSLIHGAIGCLIFAIYGRFLLGILLKNSIVTRSSGNSVVSPTTKNVEKPITARQSRPKPILRNQTSKVPPIDQPVVDTKV